MITIAPSILAANFLVLKEQLEQAQAGGADWIHVDVMDGHFVPNITFGPKVVSWVKQLTPLPLDVHLMVTEPDFIIPAYIKAGADIITVHAEAINHLNRTVGFIKSHGAKAGVSLNPGTSASSLEGIIEDVDLILAMTVNPGFGGQSFLSSSLPKIKKIREMIISTGKKIYLEVDGGINKITAATVVAAGADVLVAGSSIFEAADIKTAIHEIRASVSI